MYGAHADGRGDGPPSPAACSLHSPRVLTEGRMTNTKASPTTDATPAADAHRGHCPFQSHPACPALGSAPRGQAEWSQPHGPGQSPAHAARPQPRTGQVRHGAFIGGHLDPPQASAPENQLLKWTQGQEPGTNGGHGQQTVNSD